MDWIRVLQASQFARCVGAVEPVEAVRTRAGATPECGGITIAPALDVLVKVAKPDAVVIATSVESHAAVVEEAIAFGLGVLVEKPFTLDLASAAGLVRLARIRDVPLLVAQNYRYMRAHRTVKRLVREEVLGKLSVVSCHYWRPRHSITPSLAALESSALWETGVHHLDAIRHCFGREVVNVAADTSTAAWSRDLRGTATRVLLDFDGGMRGEYSVSWEAPGHEFFEAGQQFYERVTGERGTLHVLQRWLVLCLAGHCPRLVSRGRRDEPEESVLLKQLVRAHREGVEPECSGADNLKTLALVAACDLAARERRWVNPQDLLRDVQA